MRKLCLLVVTLFVLPFIAAAQGPAGAGGGTSRGSRSRTSELSPSEFTQWQVALGFQYNRTNLLGSPFNTEGLHVSVTHFFGRFFGLDGQVGTGFFGNTGATSNPPNLGARSFFVGGGPRLALRSRSRLEPWVHAVVGMQYFRFTQTAGLLGSNKALGGAGGGGVDFAVTRHVAIRVEGDFVETRFFSTYQRSFQAVTGFVFNF